MVSSGAHSSDLTANGVPPDQNGVQEDNQTLSSPMPDSATTWDLAATTKPLSLETKKRKLDEIPGESAEPQKPFKLPRQGSLDSDGPKLAKPIPLAEVRKVIGPFLKYFAKPALQPSSLPATSTSSTSVTSVDHEASKSFTRASFDPSGLFTDAGTTHVRVSIRGYPQSGDGILDTLDYMKPRVVKTHAAEFLCGIWALVASFNAQICQKLGVRPFSEDEVRQMLHGPAWRGHLRTKSAAFIKSCRTDMEATIFLHEVQIQTLAEMMMAKLELGLVPQVVLCQSTIVNSNVHEHKLILPESGLPQDLGSLVFIHHNGRNDEAAHYSAILPGQNSSELATIIRVAAGDEAVEQNVDAQDDLQVIQGSLPRITRTLGVDSMLSEDGQTVFKQYHEDHEGEQGKSQTAVVVEHSSFNSSACDDDTLSALGFRFEPCSVDEGNVTNLEGAIVSSSQQTRVGTYESNALGESQQPVDRNAAANTIHGHDGSNQPSASTGLTPPAQYVRSYDLRAFCEPWLISNNATHAIVEAHPYFLDIFHAIYTDPKRPLKVRTTPSIGLPSGIWALVDSFNDQICDKHELPQFKYLEVFELYHSPRYDRHVKSKSDAYRALHLEHVNLFEDLTYVKIQLLAEMMGHMRPIDECINNVRLSICRSESPGSAQHVLRNVHAELPTDGWTPLYIHHNGSVDAGHYSRITSSSEPEGSSSCGSNDIRDYGPCNLSRDHEYDLDHHALDSERNPTSQKDADPNQTASGFDDQQQAYGHYIPSPDHNLEELPPSADIAALVDFVYEDGAETHSTNHQATETNHRDLNVKASITSFQGKRSIDQAALDTSPLPVKRQKLRSRRCKGRLNSANSPLASLDSEFDHAANHQEHHASNAAVAKSTTGPEASRLSETRLKGSNDLADPATVSASVQQLKLQHQQQQLASSSADWGTDTNCLSDDHVDGHAHSVEEYDRTSDAVPIEDTQKVQVQPPVSRGGLGGQSKKRQRNAEAEDDAQDKPVAKKPRTRPADYQTASEIMTFQQIIDELGITRSMDQDPRETAQRFLKWWERMNVTANCIHNRRNQAVEKIFKDPTKSPEENKAIAKVINKTFDNAVKNGKKAIDWPYGPANKTVAQLRLLALQKKEEAQTTGTTGEKAASELAQQKVRTGRVTKTSKTAKKSIKNAARTRTRSSVSQDRHIADSGPMSKFDDEDEDPTRPLGVCRASTAHEGLASSNPALQYAEAFDAPPSNIPVPVSDPAAERHSAPPRVRHESDRIYPGRSNIPGFSHYYTQHKYELGSLDPDWTVDENGMPVPRPGTRDHEIEQFLKKHEGGKPFGPAKPFG